MADFADEAQDINEEHLAKSLLEHSEQAKRNQLKPLGYCRHCHESIAKDAKNQLFCDVDCRDDYERVHRRSK